MQPFNISGAIYIGDPTIVYVKSYGESNVLQNPKSATLITPLCNRIFEGLRSRCNIFSLNNDLKALIIYENIEIASISDNFDRYFIKSSNVPPLQNS